MAVNTLTSHNSLEDNRFKTISDFKWCMKCGGEVQFEWNGVEYGAFGKLSKNSAGNWQIGICQLGSAEVNARTVKYYDTADDALAYMVGADRLRDVITQVTVVDRTI